MVLEEFKYHVLPVRDKLYRFALRFLRNEAEAKDIVQEVLIKAWHHRDELQAPEAWCMRLTRNLSLNHLKSGHRSRTETLPEDDRYASHAASPYAQTETQDAMMHVRELLQRLPDKQRQILELRDVEGYSYQEISKVLEIDLNQVKVNLFRARQTLRKQLINRNAYGIAEGE